MILDQGLAMTLPNVLISIALLIVVAALFSGIYFMAKSGTAARRGSNTMMKLRVAAQFVAVILIALAFYFSRQ